ncbi:hypothetical protein CDO73_16970 [Saccharibacillus sp. O23]|nr:hypothetical protein CDO73_16970 [Saccharibacillus sp. O23]
MDQKRKKRLREDARPFLAWAGNNVRKTSIRSMQRFPIEARFCSANICGRKPYKLDLPTSHSFYA